MIAIWLLLVVNMILLFFGYRFSERMRNQKFIALKELTHFPMISILIPAHNEAVVIEKTLLAMIRLQYPKDAYEVIVINDNSKDDTGEIIENVKLRFPDVNINHLQIIGEKGGKGKSNALNLGYKEAKGDYFVIYDADNTPNALALRYLIQEIESNPKYAAVIGKFRTRNKDRNLLTRFINIETLSFQWMAQAGRWELFKLCTIPGTNFIIRRSIIDLIGGWDPDAIAEDTEISFRIYQMGYQIAFMPLAETYEQEPETIKVWLKQRSRWVNGNLYVLTKNLAHIGQIRNWCVLFDLFYYFSVYILFLSAIVTSDAIFVLGLFTSIRIQIPGNFLIIWLLSYFVFLLQVAITLSIERGEAHRDNLFLVSIMYFTYCQLWLIVSLKGLYHFIKTNLILKQKSKWYKTERF
jgi:hypothetical protein